MSTSMVVLMVSSIFTFSPRIDAREAPIHENMLFLHSYFKQLHWGVTRDSIDYQLASSFTSLTPVKASFAGTDTNNIAVFSSSTGQLYLMKAVLQSPGSFLDPYKMVVNDPVVSPVGTANGIWEAFARAAHKIDTIFLAFAGPTNKVAVHRIYTGNFTVTKIDTLTFTPPSGAYQVNKLYGGPDLAKDSPSCIWITGTRGLIRFFSWNGSTWSAEKVYDIDTSESITALTDKIVGTSTGKIYEDVSGSFVFHSQPITTTINAINDKIAVGDGGKVLRRRSTIWRPFSLGSSAYHYGNGVARTAGFGIELLDKGWQYSIHTLEDTITTFTVSPDSLAKYINGETFIYDIRLPPLAITIHLHDPDGNYLVPQMILNGSIDLTHDGSRKLQNMHPDTTCRPGFIELKETDIKLVLSPDQVGFKAIAREAVPDAVGSGYDWAEKPFETSNPWKEKDMIRITLGNLSLKIQLSSGPTQIETALVQSSQQEKITVLGRSSGISFSLPAHTFHWVRIYDLQGRLLYNESIPENQTTFSLPKNTSGILCLEFIAGNGTRVRKVIPIAR